MKLLSSFIIIFSFFASFLLVKPALASAPVDYLNFKSNITVSQFGDLKISEDLKVNFNEERRGIFRYIPNTYKNGLLKKVTLLEFTSITRNQNPEMNTISRQQENLEARIGNPNIFLNGEQNYQINYTVKDTIHFKENYDELYWNISGNDWEDRWKNVETIITFPENINFQHLECFTGDLGSTEQNCEISSDGNIITSSANDYLTIIAQVDKGILQTKGLFYRLGRFSLDNIILIFTLLNLIIFGRIWFKYGRAEKMKTIITEYDPPKKMTIEEIAYFFRKTSYSNIITALIISLITKKYIRMEVEPKKYFWQRDKITFFRLKENIEDLPQFEQRVFKQVLGLDKKSKINLEKLRNDNEVGKKVDKIIKDIYKQKSVQGISYYNEKSVKVSNDFSAWAIVSVVILGGGLLAIGSMKSLIYSLGAWLPQDFLFLVFTLIICLILAIHSKRKTPEAIEKLRKILGFKEFMHVAERYRSQWQERAEEFEKYLPYAILFGDTKRWLNAMGDLIESGTLNDNFRNSITGVHGTLAINSLAKSINSAVASSARSYSSSSSGSGGSSGGGGGGGGGGSW